MTSDDVARVRSGGSKLGGEEFSVLHGLRIKGLASVPALQACTGLERDVVDRHVEVLVAKGLAVRRHGVVGGVMLTPSGRTAHLATMAAQAPVPRPESLQRRFAPLNAEVKRVCSAWQVKESGEPNDHSDADYDRMVLEDLERAHSEALAFLGEFTPFLPRLTTYRDRLEYAIGRVRDGQTDSLVKPLSDSYHDVWMELHRELILSVGTPAEVAHGVASGS